MEALCISENNISTQAVLFSYRCITANLLMAIFSILSEVSGKEKQAKPETFLLPLGIYCWGV